MVRLPRTVVPGGLMFYCTCFFSSSCFGRSPYNFAIGSVFSFIIHVTKFRGPFTKNGGQKRPHLGLFRTNLDFDRKYLGNMQMDRLIFKIGKTGDRQRFLPRSGNFGPLTTQLQRWTLTHPNHLFRNTKFRPL